MIRKSDGPIDVALWILFSCRNGGMMLEKGQTKLTHIALVVSNLERSMAFYREFTDLVCVHRRVEDDGDVVAWMGDEDNRKRFVIVLLEREKEPVGVLKPINHLGFAVGSREEVDAMAAKAKEKGCLTMEPRDEGEVVGYLCLIEDPDGNTIEYSYGQDLG